MIKNPILISTGTLTHQSLRGQVAVVTGAGRGIGFETARALAWLGAHVIIAEIDTKTGKQAEQLINAEMGAKATLFVHTDIGDERSVENMVRQVLRFNRKVDIVLNNATITPMGAVKDVPIKDWDASYRVNLLGPVLLAQAFLPGMLERNYGVFVCVSSVGEAYMGAYKSFKAAQVHLARTLAAELEGTGVISFTIGPGLVRTPGAQAGIAQVAPLYGKTVEEFIAMSEEFVITVEEAGAGFAAAIALAPRFRGLEIDARAGLIAADIDQPKKEQTASLPSLSEAQISEALELSRQVHDSLAVELQGWMKMALFQRQWTVRDFKKYAGITVEQCLDALERLETALQDRDMQALAVIDAPARVAKYYTHYQELARGYIKDQTLLDKQLVLYRQCQEKAEKLASMITQQENS